MAFGPEKLLVHLKEYNFLVEWLDLISAALECDWPTGPLGWPGEQKNSRMGSGLILLRLNEPLYTEEDTVSNSLNNTESFVDK